MRPLHFPHYAQLKLPSIFNLGRVARDNFSQTHILHNIAGDITYVLGFLVAIILWGFGIVWLFFALATIYKSYPLPFNMGWWGFTFPLGVYALSTITLGTELPSEFFKIFGIVSIRLLNNPEPSVYY